MNPQCNLINSCLWAAAGTFFLSLLTCLKADKSARSLVSEELSKSEVSQDEPRTKLTQEPIRVDPRVRSILKKLESASDPYKDLEDSYRRRHEQFAKQRLKGTCKWFLQDDQYTRWLEDSSHQVFWCWGSPGIGKRTITCESHPLQKKHYCLTSDRSKVIDSLVKQGRSHAFYYMGHGKVQSAAGVVLCLLEQFCAGNDCFPPCLELYVEEAVWGLQPPLEKPTPNLELSLTSIHLEEPLSGRLPFQQLDTGTSTSPKQPSSLGTIPALDVLLSALRHVSERLKDSIIIVAGWDAHNMDSEEEFSRTLAFLEKLPWKVFIASRREPKVDVSTSIRYVGKEHNVEDIEKYVMSIINTTLMEKYGSLVEVQDRLVQNRMVQVIVSDSQGM